VSAASPDEAWATALEVARLLAVAPHALGGVHVRAAPGPARTAFGKMLERVLLRGAPVKRVPAGIGEDRLIGGLDLTATLAAGRPVAERGVLAAADGGVVVLAMAERASGAVASGLARALDTGEVRVERDGVGATLPARVGVVALDEGLEEETIAAALAERLAFRVDLDGVPPRAAVLPPPEDLAAARALFPSVAIGDGALGALCAAALACGVDSLRASHLAALAARARAALAGRGDVADEDVGRAAALVLAHRATRLPSADEPEEEAPPEPPSDPPETPPDDQPSDPSEAQALADRAIEAVEAALPPDLLARLAAMARAGRGGGGGRKGEGAKTLARGRPVGTRAGDPRRGARLDVVATLRAAAPWQRLRGATPGRVAVRRDDLRVKRMVEPRRATSVFVVDASGSTALARLSEAKGAVELLLADSYVRRDEVALVAVKGAGAELILPPTRSLARAKRALTGLPGGGGTPLAAGIDAARLLADRIARAGAVPLLVFLTDGQANIARDGTPGREGAARDALASAEALARAGRAVLLVDTSPRPRPQAREIAERLRARYLALPSGDQRRIAAEVRSERSVLDI
jgi:magnesium chelatase subunit D